MATLKALTITFTLLYFLPLSSARISVPLNNVQLQNDIPQQHASKKTLLLHKPFDQFLYLDAEPDIIGFERSIKSKDPDPTTFELKQSKNDDHVSLDPTIFQLTKVMNDVQTNNEHKPSEPTNYLPTTKSNNDEHESLDPTIVEMETESNEPMTQSKNNKHAHLPIKEHHETDKDLPVVSENTVSIETLHLNPSKYVIRPINRHFRIRRCRHHMKQDHQIPYGNNIIMGEDDMTLARQTIERFDPSVLHISTHSAPAKRPRIHHYYHRHDEDDNMMRHPFRQHNKKQVDEESDAFKQWLAKQKLKKQVEEEIQKRKESDARKGGFMKSFRKFLNHI